ncbi:MAG: hypothetical protein ABL984_01425 [Pyrinomonadaceae bacterium]
MAISKYACRLSFGLCLMVVFAIGPPTVFGQTEKLGVVKYTPPRGMTKLPKENTIVFSEFDQATGKFCIITLYGATPGTGNAKSDFAREWNNLVVKTFTKAEANPSTETSSEDGWTAIGGGSEVEGGVGKAVAFLTVVSGFGQTVSILGVFNDQAHAAKLASFITALEMDKVKAPPANVAHAAATRSDSASGTAAFDAGGDLIIPQPSRQLTTADIAGVWIDGPNRMTTEYVYSGSGKSAGRDTTAFQVKTTFKSDGTYSSFFNSVRNKYETESDAQAGPYSINGRLLSIQGKTYSGKPRIQKYVIRGWLELPTMTVLELASGPWYDNDPIPEVHFTDFNSFESKHRGSEKWIRIK